MKYQVERKRVLTLITNGTIKAVSKAHAQELSEIHDLDDELIVITDHKTIQACLVEGEAA